MVAWSDYKAAARERGSLACELFVVISTPVKDPEVVRAVLPEHLAYQQQLEDEAVLAFAGPLSDDTGEHMQGTGMIIYRAESMESAKQYAEADPMHAQQVRSYTLRRWLVNEGSLQLNLKLSAQSVTLD
jgi:uncharacterized protein YciI